MKLGNKSKAKAEAFKSVYDAYNETYVTAKALDHDSLARFFSILAVTFSTLAPDEYRNFYSMVSESINKDQAEAG